MFSLVLALPLVTLAAPTIIEYPIPTASSTPVAITTGPDGNLWFTEDNGNKIGKLTTAGSFTEYTIPTANSRPLGITAGPDNNLWFTEAQGNKIGKVLTSGNFTEYTIPTANSSPIGITAGPDGNLWFTEFSTNKIGKLTTAGSFTEYTIPTANSLPNGITTGPDGNLWFTENSGSKIGMITTVGSFTEYTIPTASSSPNSITAGPDGNLWFTENSTSKIGKLTTAGSFTEYTIPSASSSPRGIVAGSDGNLWFTENGNSKIGMVTTAGSFTEYTIPTAPSLPIGITTGPDGNLWFTENRSNKIGEVVLRQPLTLSMAFSPNTIQIGGTSTLTFTVTNPNTTGSFTNVSFAGPLPAGVALATPVYLASTCGGTAIAGFGPPATIDLYGGSVAANQTCTVSVNVTSAASGVYTSTMSQIYSNETGTISSNASATLYVTVIPTTLTLTDNGPNPATFGQSVNFTATVAPLNATGIVTFTEGATVVGTATLGGGTASFSTSTLPVGSHNIVATYGGDATYLFSTSNTVTQVVSPISTTLSLTSNPNPSTLGQSVTFTATLSPVAASGTVTFSEGATNLGTATVSGGVATFSTSSLAVGSHSISALYGGNSSYAAANSSSLTQVVNPASSTTTLSAAPNPASFGQSVTFTATVNPTTATGTVTFNFDNTTPVTATLDANGVATCVTTTLGLGQHHLVATYNGDTKVTSSSSAPLTLTITAGAASQIVVVSGSGQSAPLNTAFAAPLVAQVKDSFGNLVSGASVTFSAPGNGASGTFAGGTAVYTGTTDASGVVTATAFTSNSVPGVYTVTAMVGSVTNPATFALTNLAGCNPLRVTSNLDDGSCGTLRYAVLSLASPLNSKSKIITVDLSAGSVITLTSGLTLTSGMSITTTAQCGVGTGNTMLPPVTLQGVGSSSGVGLTLAGNNQLYGLWVRGFSGVQIKALPRSHTKMQCVKASKL